MLKQLDIIPFLKTAETVADQNTLPEELVISAISIDSRTIWSGALFIAITGENFNGHDFVGAAAQKGAAACIVEEAIPNIAVPQVVVRDCGAFLLEIAAWYRRLFNTPVIGITGSAGKTTVKDFVYAVISTKYKSIKTQGNFNNFIGVPLTLFQMDENTEAAVVEIGTNHPGEIAVLAKTINPTHALITNIGTGHIGNFGSQQAIFEEKTAIFSHVKSGGKIFVNMNDPYLKDAIFPDVQQVPVGSEGESNSVSRVAAVDDSGVLTLEFDSLGRIKLPIPGPQQQINAEFAIAIGQSLAVPFDAAKTALENLKITAQRMELFEKDRIIYINDAYNANRESTYAAIDYLNNLPVRNGARKFFIMGDMLELGDLSEVLHRDIGVYLENKNVQFVFTFGQFAKKISDHLCASGVTNKNIRHFDKQSEITELLKKSVKVGDVVLIKGSRGMAMENVIKPLGVGN